ncbi:neutral/alkaline non-lysosomal ceramidase N-terminal domain-containing protein [Paenibacillus flagellatus]|uniref:neutral/alkaline non-lysosomal ceramidase N-terminal domain-containing protein n=1 Tax=Paenibacillus flagellatus TaxID=2211139 RepID=UPI00130517B1|nr:neutral/alkaline non-lysosomal ceramidase N-terminal domain-containing protein [Paenibacillus flagellatus]
MIRCGMSEVDVTPPLGGEIPGYFGPRTATGVRDPLYAKSLVLESSDGTLAAIVAVDALSVPRETVEAVRQRLKEAAGFDPAHVFVSTTHTHTGGPVSTGFGCTEDPGYLDWLARKAADSALLAYRSRREARIGFGLGREADIAFNRRYFMKDGSFRTNPGVGNPNIDRPAGPIDPDVLVMRIDDAEGRPIGVVSNYACHTDTVGGTEYGADFPGELSRFVKRALGEQAVSLFLLGSCGDINHIDVSGKRAKSPDHYRRMGRILGAEVVRTREKIDVADEADVAALSGTFEVDLRSPPEAELAAAKRLLEEGTDDVREATYARELLKIAAECPVASRTVEVQAMRIGDMALVGFPGEIFVEFGLDVKRKSRFAYTMIDTMCNGSVRAYICTRDAFRQGGYEPRMTFRNRFPEETGERMVGLALELLERLGVGGTR